MDSLLSILMYINVVTSPGTYTYNQVELLLSSNSAQITVVENNPALLNLAISEFYEEAEGITILDEPAG